MLDVKLDFPGYPKEGIYLDSATVGLQPQVSIDQFTEFVTHHNYTVRKSLHNKARINENAYYESKEKLATMVGAKDDQIAWVQNADTAINILIHAFMNQKGDKKINFITSIFEHHSILAPLLTLKRSGKINLKVLGLEEEPCIDQYIDEHGQAGDVIILGHTTQTLGLYRDVHRIAQSAKTKGCYTVIDFSRTAGQSNFAINWSLIDAGVFEGSLDLLGPISGSFMVLTQVLINILDNPFPSSGNVGRVTRKKALQIENISKFEIGAPNIAALVGLTASVGYLDHIGFKNIASHRRQIQSNLITQLNELESITLIDPFYDDLYDNKHRSSIISIKGDFHSHDVALFLDESYNIQIRSGLLCSHPGVTELGLEEIIQISTHIYNTNEDVEALIQSLQEIFHAMG